MKRCPFCAEEIQDAAIVKHCGRDLTETATVQHGAGSLPPRVSEPRPSARRLTWTLLGLLVLVVGVLVVARSEPGDMGSPIPMLPVRVDIATGEAKEVPATGYLHYAFTLPARTCTVTGRILGVSGGSKDFQALLMDDDNFRNWSTNHETRVYWQTDKVAAATINATIAGPGTFHLVISNAFSLFTPKTVEASAEASC